MTEKEIDGKNSLHSKMSCLECKQQSRIRFSLLKHFPPQHRSNFQSHYNCVNCPYQTSDYVFSDRNIQMYNQFTAPVRKRVTADIATIFAEKYSLRLYFFLPNLFAQLIFLYSEYRSVFQIFDKNGDDKISTSELGAVLSSLGQEPSDDKIQQMIKEYDADGKIASLLWE